jgi:hypothetical protein
MVALAGVDLYGRTACDVFADKCYPANDNRKRVSRAATLIGHALEPVALTLLAEDQNLWIVRSGTIRSREHPWALATPDGVCIDAPLVEDAEGARRPLAGLLEPGARLCLPGPQPLTVEAQALADGEARYLPDFGCLATCEAKAVGGFMRQHWADGLPHSVNVQLHWQMVVLGLRRGYVSALLGHEHQVFIVERDEALATALLTLGDRFWRHNVLANRAPLPDGSDGAGRMVAAMFERPKLIGKVSAPAEAESWALQYAEADARAKLAKRQKAEAQQNLQRLIGDAEGIASPNFEATWKWRPESVRKACVQRAGRRFYFSPKAGDVLLAAKSAPSGDDDE